ncbi:hypothetical protein [Butyrivibrio sp. MB2005]|uniref:hypothetical protein n=1 Tax=Butyrivibrio sp. MB2005 TaxID=1280678 RepID=UPI002FE65898
MDVTGLIESQNKIEITVANGWFKGILGFYGQGCHYGNRTALIALFIRKALKNTVNCSCDRLCSVQTREALCSEAPAY